MQKDMVAAAVAIALSGGSREGLGFVPFALPPNRRQRLRGEPAGREYGVEIGSTKPGPGVRFKGSKAAKAAARQAQKRAKASTRARLQAKRERVGLPF